MEAWSLNRRTLTWGYAITYVPVKLKVALICSKVRSGPFLGTLINRGAACYEEMGTFSSFDCRLRRDFHGSCCKPRHSAEMLVASCGDKTLDIRNVMRCLVACEVLLVGSGVATWLKSQPKKWLLQPIGFVTTTAARRLDNCCTTAVSRKCECVLKEHPSLLWNQLQGQSFFLFFWVWYISLTYSS